MKEELLRLEERCEAAQGPDRELDAAIGSTIYQMKVGHEVPGIEGCYHELFTASLDAAMTLVPEGCNFALCREGGVVSASVPVAGDRQSSVCFAATPALALCAAALRASVKEQNNGK